MKPEIKIEQFEVEETREIGGHKAQRFTYKKFVPLEGEGGLLWLVKELSTNLQQSMKWHTGDEPTELQQEIYGSEKTGDWEKGMDYLSNALKLLQQIKSQVGENE